MEFIHIIKADLTWNEYYFISFCVIVIYFALNFILQVSSANATPLSQPILHLSGDSQAQVAQVAQGQDLTAAGQTLQSVQLVNPGTFLIQAQTVTATGQIQWQTFQVYYSVFKVPCSRKKTACLK